MSCWINTISLEHVRIGVKGGFTQAGHGSERGLKRLVRGDRIVFYSPKEHLDGGKPVQAFTAIGTILDDEPFQVTMTDDFRPWRRAIDFDGDVRDAPIRPLLDKLSFIADPKHWGFPFRRGLFEVPEPDFLMIAAAMRPDSR